MRQEPSVDRKSTRRKPAGHQNEKNVPSPQKSPRKLAGMVLKWTHYLGATVPKILVSSCFPPCPFFPPSPQALLSDHLINLQSNGLWSRALSMARRKLCISHRWRGRQWRSAFRWRRLLLLLSLHPRHRRWWARRRRRSKGSKSQRRWPQNLKEQKKSWPSNRFQQWQRRSSFQRRMGLSLNLHSTRSHVVAPFSSFWIDINLWFTP